ncbi:MAG: transaldolase [Gammaproteobacteria bacterium RIFCSPHIGHO2_12_FULL_40_19]|nr:MAG: transaldolase [Gammaproteobacteria bacterium RIFCSPHIGHO2_12_FULL_40_19]
MTIKIADLSIKIYADGADKDGMLEMAKNPIVKGFTTNPTLMRKAGITDFELFARDILINIPNHSISFEVFSDDFDEMYRQALKISSWGSNVYVKIPVTNTKGESSLKLIQRLANDGIKQNITAMMTLEQVQLVSNALSSSPPSYVSVFAGRIADTGFDPVPLMQSAVKIISVHPHLELIWASPRELLNIFHANQIGCHIITVTNDILRKLSLCGKDLTQYSLETVQMFRNDAVNAGYQL